MEEPDGEGKLKRRGKKGGRTKDASIKNVSQDAVKTDEGKGSEAKKPKDYDESAQISPSSSQTQQKRIPASKKAGVHGQLVQWKYWNIVKNCATAVKWEDMTGRSQVNLVLIVLVFLAVLTRVWIISEPKFTVFDEVHFGKFSSLYLQGKHFFDVHPPMGKLIFAAVGYVFGYDGRFLFEKINMEYPSYVPYITLRTVSAIAGVLLVPCVYQIMRLLGFSNLVSNFAALFIVFDNALIIQSRVIMLDSMAILMTYVTVLFYLKLCHCDKMWSAKWNAYLLLSALSLGTLLGIKYTGILGMGFLGIIVLVDLYQLIGDKDVTLISYSHGFFVRGIALVGIPLLMNMGLFYIHFTLLTKAGIHEGWLSPQLRANMEGTQLQIAHDPNATMLRYGTVMTLKHSGSSCWLHSHDHVYPLKYDDGRGSSHQQHVTCYEFKDKNNEWIIRKPGSPDDSVVPNDPSPVRHGDIVEFVHAHSKKLLNSHDVAAPLTPQNQEVAGYINYSAKFVPQLHWKIEVQHNAGNYPIYWLPRKTQITLRHENSGQLLTTTGKRLPEWGFKQYEVVTSKTADTLSSLWFMDDLIVPGDAKEPNEKDSLSMTASEGTSSNDSDTKEQEESGPEKGLEEDELMKGSEEKGNEDSKEEDELVKGSEEKGNEDSKEEDELAKGSEEKGNEGSKEEDELVKRTEEEANEDSEEEANEDSEEEANEDSEEEDELDEGDEEDGSEDSEEEDELDEGDEEDESEDNEEVVEEDYLKPPLPGNDGQKQTSILSFWERYRTVQTQMLTAHGSMSDHDYGSKPLQWLLLIKTLPYWLDSSSNAQITLIGNPFTWWAGSVACVIFPVLLMFYILRRRRKCYDIPEGEFFQYSRSGTILLVGWLIHYLPFFLISRVLFLHHYLPALPFKYMLLAAMIEHLLNFLYRRPLIKKFARVYLPVIIATAVVAGFIIFSPFTYAANISREGIASRHWIQSWDFLFHIAKEEP